MAHPKWLMPKCGMPETPDHTPTAPSAATSLDQSTDSYLVTLHRAVIGPINADYYLPLLARFDAYGRASPSWNWAACVTTLNWMVFRGMWMPALLYGAALAGAALGVQTVIMLAAPMTASLQWSLWAALATLALLIPGFFGNIWLYGAYGKRLEKALTATPNLKQASMLLVRWSSSRPRLVAIAVANLVLAGLIAAWVWPSDLHMRMWPRVSGEVQDMAQPYPAEPPASTSGPASGNAWPLSSSQDTAAVASDAAAAPASTDSAIAAAAVASASVTTVAAASAGAVAAPASTADPAAVVAPTSVTSAAKAAEATSASVAASSAAPTAALSVTPGTAAPASQPTEPLAQPLGPSASATAAQNAAISAHARAARLRPAPIDTAKTEPTDPLSQPLGPSARATAAQNAAIAAHARAARARPAPAATTKPQPRPAPQTKAKPPVVASSKVAPATGRYQINVGLFAQQDNARRVHARLEKAGLPVISDTLQMRNGERTRVRVGPFTTQAQANAAAERVRVLQLDAIVVRR